MHRFSVGRGVATPCWVGQRQKLSTTSFLTLAAAARSQRAVLKWMRPKGCQKQQKAISSLYRVFKHIQLSPATAIFFLSMNVMHDHQFLFISDRVVRSCKSLQVIRFGFNLSHQMRLRTLMIAETWHMSLPEQVHRQSTHVTCRFIQRNCECSWLQHYLVVTIQRHCE